MMVMRLCDEVIEFSSDVVMREEMRRWIGETKRILHYIVVE